MYGYCAAPKSAGLGLINGVEMAYRDQVVEKKRLKKYLGDLSLNAHHSFISSQDAPLKTSRDGFGMHVEFVSAINAPVERDDLGGRVSRASPRAACLALSSYS